MSFSILSVRKTEKAYLEEESHKQTPIHMRAHPPKESFHFSIFLTFASMVMKGFCFWISCMGSIIWTPLLIPWAICATLIPSSHFATGETSILKSITIKEQGVLEEMTDPTQPTVLPDGIGQSWNCKFWEDFTTPNCLQDRFWHPCGSGKWKWDAVSWKEIHWEPACSQIVQDPATQKSILRVCVFSDWFHRIDRLATKEQFGYGYYEARCRFKGASGMHSAFWLLPNAMDEVDTSPGLIPGGIEVDVVEHRGFNATNNDISTIGVTTMHWGGYGAHHHSAGYRESNLPTSNSDIVSKRHHHLLHYGTKDIFGAFSVWWFDSMQCNSTTKFIHVEMVSESVLVILQVENTSNLPVYHVLCM